MLRKLHTIIVGILVAFPVAAMCQITFTHIGSQAELSSCYVKAITQDNYGYMWFATKNGLYRYDGQRVHRYTVYDAEQKRGNNNIGALFETPDHKMLVGTDRGVFSFDPHTERFTAITQKSKEGVSADDWVQSIVGDKHGNTWVLVPNQGAFRYQKNGKVDYYSVTNHNGNKNKLPQDMISTASGDIFVTTIHQGVWRFDYATNSFRAVVTPERFDDSNVNTSHLCETPDGQIVIGSLTGYLWTWNPRTDKLSRIPFSHSGHVYLRDLRQVGSEIWIGTQRGLYIIDTQSGNEEFITSRMKHRGLSDDCVYCIYADKDKNLWLGTMFGGVSFYQRNGFAFHNYATNSPVRGMAQTADGTLWIGSERAGISSLNPKTGVFTPLLSGNNDYSDCLTMKYCGGRLYAGFMRKGLVEMDHSGIRRNWDFDLVGHNGGSAYSVLHDRDGCLWIGMDWGLVCQTPDGKFHDIDNVGYDWFFDIFQDSRGIIWFASMGNGVWIHNPKTGKYKHYPFTEDHKNGLRSNCVSSVMEDSRGTIWLSTDRGGLSRYDAASDRFVTYGTEEGLPDNTVYDVLEDEKGFLWFGTDKGLVKFNPQTATAKTFLTADGLACDQFYYHNALKDDNGTFWFGGLCGVVGFRPSLEAEPVAVPPIYFTHFYINFHEVLPGAKDSPLKESIFFTDKITLPYDVGNFSISVSSPNYTDRAGAYSYRLSPTSKEWIPIGPDHRLSFASLAPGTYTLEVRVANGSAESMRSMTIRILPPWYFSIWANIAYFVMVCIAIWLMSRWYLLRKKRQLEEKEKLFTINKEKELYKNKMQFFAEIAHEIRTPLTLIRTPLEAIRELEINDKRVKRYLRIMQQNTMRLLDLTAQLLDFQKIENRRGTLRFEQVDVSALIQSTLDRFTDTMTLKKKNLTANIPDTPIPAVIDREAVTKILSNLFNNALKYSAEKIEVTLKADKRSFTLCVSSDGQKIAQENRDKIFDAFFQIDENADNGGVGIGLPLSLTLAKLHNGDILLADDDTPMNTFVLNIPLQQENVEIEKTMSPAMTEYVMEEDTHPVSELVGYSLLFVDDNEDMRDFLAEQLSESFNVETAADGNEALAKLKEHPYDIVVTDIMMPGLDGYELCKLIKGDDDISHTPVVFLTAKNDIESKVAALSCGGEAYIEKPFSIKYFRQQIISLLDNRRNERKAYLKKPFFTVDNMKMSKSDEEFMNKVVESINKNIDDDSFSVETMADVLCMSRSSLLRKIKSLFNLSPVELIRLVRMKRAAELIQEGDHRISEICYLVGFNSSSYFSKLFFRQFGVTPKAFAKQCEEKKKQKPQHHDGE